MIERPINSITTTGSGIVRADGFENISFQFRAASISSGNGVLTLLGSNDGTNYTAISFVDPTPANTNSQTITRLLSKTLSSNTSGVGCIDNNYKFAFLKFTVTVTTDGTYDVFVSKDIKDR